MKEKWLFLSLCCIAGIYFHDNVFILVMILGFYYLRYRDKSIFLCLYLMLILWFLSIESVTIPTTNIGKVIKLNSNSIIMQMDDGTKVIGYNFKNVFLDEIIFFEGDYSLIQSSPTTYGFNYEKWCHQNKIYYSVYARNMKVVQKTSSIRGLLQQKLEKLNSPIRDFLRMTLFSISDESFGSLDDFLILSGTHISSLFQMIERMLSFFFESSGIITLILMIIMGSIFNFQFIYRRLIIQKILSFFKISPKDRLGILIILLLLFDVRCIYSTAFIYPILMKLILCFNPFKTFFMKVFSVSFIQCILNYQVNLLQIIFFPVLRNLISFGMILSTGCIFFPFLCEVVISYIKFLQIISDCINGFYKLNGSLQFPLACILFFLICSRKKANNIKAFLIFGAVLILNINHWIASVSFINVGQGDCVLIQLPFNKGNYLIDTGPAVSYSNLRSFLLAKGVRNINAIFITHYDEDHSGNLSQLKKDFDIEKVIDKKQEEYHDSNFSMLFLLPDYKDENENKNSLILMSEINGLRFLFLGDITSAEEKLLVNTYNNLKADVIKIAHHGAATSTSELFLDQIQGEYAIISSGLNNRYHHPSEEVINRLSRYPLHIYSTAEMGDISFILTRLFNLICTSKKFLI